MKTRYLIPIFGLFLIGFTDAALAQATSKPSSADTLTAKLVGVWMRVSQHTDISFDFVYTYRASGELAERSTRHFQGKATTTNSSGTWEMKDGVLIITAIKSDSGTPGIPHPLHRPIVTAYKIVRITDNEMVLQSASSAGKALGDEVWRRQG